MRSFSRAGLGAVTAAAMATSTFRIIVASFSGSIMGYSVDTLGTYARGWLAMAGLLFVAVLLSYEIPGGTARADTMGAET